MGTRVQWERYALELAPAAAWEIPDTPDGRDLAQRLVAKNDAGAALLQSLQLTKRAWGALPAEVRGAALEALNTAAEQVLEGLESATATIDMAPVIGQIVNAALAMIMGFVKLGTEIKAGNREISNYAHQRAQYRTIAKLGDPWTWVYSGRTCAVYAQYVGSRQGPNWDIKPGFTRSGLERDKPFLGVASPADTGDCKKPIRVGLDYPFDPPSDCRRVLGLSALFYPWWAGAYAPEPLPVWDSDTPFQPNELLMQRQQLLVSDPYTNLRCPLPIVLKIRDRLLAWWSIDRKLVPIDKKGNVTGSGGPRVDAKENPNHIPSKSAAARWYLGPDGMVRAYPNQPDSDLARWGRPAAPGDPSNLGVTLAQRNTVVAMCAAFAARRQATIRDGKLAAGLLKDYGPHPFEEAAVPALEYAAQQRKTLPLIAESKPLVFAAPKPLTRFAAPAPIGDDSGDGAIAAAGLAALLLL